MWRRQWHPTPVLLHGKFHGWRSLVGCSLWGCQAPDATEQLHFHFSLSCIGEGNGNSLQCSCLENPRDGGSLVGCRLWGRTESDTTEATQQQQQTNENLTVQLREPYSVLCGDLNGKEIQKRGDICRYIADSLCCTIETSTTLQSNYTPIK